MPQDYGWANRSPPSQLLSKRARDVPYAPGDSAAWNGTDWEQISLAIHRLSTNGVHYRLVKRLLDILIVFSFLPCLLPLFLIVAAIVLLLSSPGPILYRLRDV